MVCDQARESAFIKSSMVRRQDPTWREESDRDSADLEEREMLEGEEAEDKARDDLIRNHWVRRPTVTALTWRREKCWRGRRQRTRPGII